METSPLLGAWCEHCCRRCLFPSQGRASPLLRLLLLLLRIQMHRADKEPPQHRQKLSRSGHPFCCFFLCVCMRVSEYLYVCVHVCVCVRDKGSECEQGCVCPYVLYENVCVCVLHLVCVVACYLTCCLCVCQIVFFLIFLNCVCVCVRPIPPTPLAVRECA